MEELETNDGHFHRCLWLIQRAEHHRESILDVGCADAFMFRDRPELDVVEVDLVHRIPAGYRVRFVRADAHHLPFRPQAFQCGVYGDILEHVQHPVQVLREAKRVAHSIYVTVPDEHSWSQDKRPFQSAPHIRFYTVETLRGDLDEALGEGYRIVRIKGGGWSFFAVEWSHK